MIINFFGKDRKLSYSNYFRSNIPYFIAKMSGIEIKTTAVNEDKYFDDEYHQMSAIDKIKDGIKGDRINNYASEETRKIRKINALNTEQFMTSGIVEADEYYTFNIAQFIHKNTDTKIDFYHASASKVEKIIYRKNGKKYTERKEKVLTSGVVFSFSNLYNIKLNGYRILIKDDDTLLSHLTENTVDSIKQNKNEIKFNRIDLNKSFDFFVYSEKENIDLKTEALQIVTPVVEDLISYIRKKYGRFNMAINNNKIDIELLDTSIIGGNRKNYKDIVIEPKLFSNKDLKISYLYRFYELIEIQKLILKYLNCYPERYFITEEDVNGLKEAIESKKLTNYEMDNSI